MTNAGKSGRRALRIDGLRRTVSDLSRSIDFYASALGFELDRSAAASANGGARLRLGEQHIDLILADGPVPMLEPACAPDPRFQHAAIVTADMAAAWRRLASHATVAISRGGPERLPANTGGVTAFKFRDPDGHPLELIQFPAGVGDPRWQRARSGGSTLGIDHFALVIEEVERSVRFCAEQLGLRLASRDVNRGPEQDRLDGLADVEVDVIALEPSAGSRTPHLELLCYRRPALPEPTAGSLARVERAGRDEIVCLSERRPGTTDAAPAGALRLDDPDGHRFIVH